MFSSLQDAIKKLHENKKQTQPPPAKRPAVAPIATSSNADARDQDGALDFDLGTLDELHGADGLLDDLLDEDLGLDMPGLSPSPRPPPPALQKRIQRPVQILPSARPAPRPQSPAQNLSNQPRPPASTPHRPVPHQSLQFTPPQRPPPPSQPNIGSQPFRSPYSTPRPLGARRPGSVVHQVESVARTRPTATGTPATGPASTEIPGPAGLIGKQVSLSSVTQRPAPQFRTPLTKKVRSECAADSDFASDTWAELLKFLKMPDYKPSNAASITADIDHAKWPIRTVLQYTETKRVPTMLVRISDVHSSDVDSSAVLVDPTGEMRASVHKQVMRKYGQFLAADSSIVLRDVVSMKMPGTPPFLVVTEASIEKIFAPDHANRPGQITVSQMNRPINLVTQDSVHQMTAETPSRASKQPAQENPMLGSKNQQQKAIDLDTAQPEQPADDLFDLGSIDMSFFNDD